MDIARDLLEEPEFNLIKWFSSQLLKIDWVRGSPSGDNCQDILQVPLVGVHLDPSWSATKWIPNNC